MKSQKEAGKPFFAYIPTNAPHSPYIAKPEDAALYEGKVDSKAVASFFGMIHNIDLNVGELLGDLKDWDIDRDTIVIFMNDNGTAAGASVFNAGMRGAKGSVFLGGTRASAFWRWPGKWEPGGRKALAAHIDIYPTLAQIAGVELPAGAVTQIEGRSLLPLLHDPGADWPDRFLFTHQGRWPKGADPNGSKFKMGAVRNTRWALVSDKGGSGPNWQLFDLTQDYGEKNDVAGEHPAVVKELAAAYDQWWSECLPLMVNEKAVGPKLNPFAVRYWKQFGGGPTEADYRRMDPARPIGNAGKKKRAKEK
jgi:arylsulfatase